MNSKTPSVAASYSGLGWRGIGVSPLNTTAHGFRQQCAVGQQFHFHAGFRSQADHFQNVPVEQGFTHAAEEHGLHGLGHGFQHMAVIFQRKVAHGLIKPGVAEAHFAVEIAFGGGFDVQLS